MINHGIVPESDSPFVPNGAGQTLSTGGAGVNLLRRLRDPAFGTETSERNLMNAAADYIERLELALEWALDHATDSDHAHYPERVLPREAYAVWQYPYLVSGTPMGGGVGHASFPTALEAVEAARMEERS